MHKKLKKKNDVQWLINSDGMPAEIPFWDIHFQNCDFVLSNFQSSKIVLRTTKDESCITWTEKHILYTSARNEIKCSIYNQ